MTNSDLLMLDEPLESFLNLVEVYSIVAELVDSGPRSCLVYRM